MVLGSFEILRRENLVDNSATAFCYLVVLNEKFLTQLASGLILQIEQGSD
ncbi:hypothetical protein PFLA_a0996 [Pseudoalteromonas flavipulchra NCIMB 2033 = ATCC BAA-314]|nr:hypothetical protein [Pseudoalteromonas flavipulchra NCIMB 2033 = ATCC BAA-314]